MIAVCIALLALQALAVLAYAPSYTASGIMRAATGVSRMPQIRAAAGCNVEITADPGDIYFIGKARRECVEKNKYNLACQQQCWDQVKALASGWMGRARGMGVYSRLSCKDIDPALLSGAAASRCYFQASNECRMANPGSDYCRRKCVQKTYSVCRQNVFQGRYR